eukprot:jgi/Tetstr1/423580/TSEL_014252.t1
MVRLTNALLPCRSLAALELGRALAEGNSTLQHLLLHNNPVGWQGARKLLRATLAEHIKGIELCDCHLLHRPAGAAEFDPRFPWGGYELDLAVEGDRAVAIQLAEVTLTDTLACPEWVDATLDGKPFTLVSAPPEGAPPAGDLDARGLKSSSDTFGLPAEGRLRLTLERTKMALPEPDEQPVKDGVLQAMWEKSVVADKGSSDDWKLQLLGIMTTDYFFTMQQLCYIATKLFGRLTNPQDFQLLADSKCIPDFALAQLQDTLGMSARFLPTNPTGHYDLMVGLVVDNAIAWRLLAEFRRQHLARLCREDEETGFRVTCWPAASINGRTLHVTQPLEFSIPRSGVLSVDFVDLRPAETLPPALGELHCRCLLGYLGEAKPLKHAFLRAFLTDPDLQLRAKRVHGLSVRVMGGDLPGTRLPIKDLQNAVPVLRALSVEVSLSCKQICRLLKMCSHTALVSTHLQLEVITAFWGRCVDRENWSEVLSTLGADDQVKFCQMVGYCAVFNRFNPCMSYELRMWRRDELYVAKALHEVAAAMKKGHPYSQAYILYPDRPDWMSLEEALSTRTREWAHGLGAIWEAFADGVRDETTTIRTTVKFVYEVGAPPPSERWSRLTRRAPQPRRFQRIWRAWRANKSYLTLLVTVDLIKLKLLRLVCRKVVRFLEERLAHRNVRYEPELAPSITAAVAQLHAITRRAFMAIFTMRGDPMGLLRRVKPGASAKLHRDAVAAQGGQPALQRDGGASYKRIKLQKVSSVSGLRQLSGASSAWEAAREELGVESITVEAFRVKLDV